MTISAGPTYPPPDELARPGDPRVTWLIARRGALESLRDRMTVGYSAVFALALPFLVVLVAIRPQASHGDAGTALGALMATYLLVVGMMPSTSAVSVASGMFAGEKEQGNLAPLLATPASNRAIFAGKVLGAVLPPLLYALIAETSYLVDIALLLGPGTLRLLPAALSLAMVVLVPTYAILGAAVASLISSRVRTYQGAQTVSSLVLLPVMAVLFGLAFALQKQGPGLLVLTVVAMIALDTALILLGAARWRREEVMAHHPPRASRRVVRRRDR